MTNIIKYIHQWHNVGIQKQRIQSLECVNKCPMCGQLETQHHYLTCSDLEWMNHKREAWKQLKQKLLLNKTHSQIISILSLVINSNFEIHNDLLQENTDSEFSQLINQAIIDQQSIGWHHILLGRVAKSWSTAQ